jgi:excisionase family DNA binding protein
MVIDITERCDNMNDISQNTRILTVKEVAEILRIHRSTVSRYAMSGELRSYVIGNRRLFKESDVWAFFDNQVDRIYVSKEG